MADIPTILTIYNRLSNDLRNRLDLSDSDLKKVLDAFSIAISGEIKLLYLFLSDVQNEIYPDTANTSENGGTLDRQGLIYLNRIRRPSTSGVFEISVNGEAGSVLRTGLTFKSNDDALNPGQVYILDQEYTLTGSNDVVSIRSLSGGSEVLLENNDALTITEPVIGVEQTVNISSILEQPLSEESVEEFRNDILLNRQLEPQGGARTDYRLWASDAQGVRFVYPYLKDGNAGTVQIYVEATKEDSVDGLGTPSQEILDSVRDVVEFDPDISLSTNERGRRPLQATIELLPIRLNPIDITITGLQDSSQSIRDSLEPNIIEFLSKIRPYIAGADLARNKNDILYAARVQSVVTDILDNSNFFVNFEMSINGVGQNSFLFSRENIPYLRSITFN